eukprot:TRINITY_DN6854_c0_g1_i10.p1 TRINITY_DN6854_c0_g1~~TRINITY_DN6854_c0_g1_i10.p1  ORF type:complete len:271 (-),score=41.38 TRINITY_DN6854_c0_g1_i10:413-1225(-)
MSPENHVVGRFQSLKSLNHPSLCQYIEIINGNYENRVFVVSEHYAKNLRMELRESISAGQKGLSENRTREVMFEILVGLNYLRTHGIVHRNLSLDNILVDSHNHVKLADYGLFHVTGYGSFVNFPIGNPHYLSPEIISSAGTITCWFQKLNSKCDKKTSQQKSASSFDSTTEQSIYTIQMESVLANLRVTHKSDIWTLGIMLVELLTGECPWIIEQDIGSGDGDGCGGSDVHGDPYLIMLNILKFAGMNVEIDHKSSRNKVFTQQVRFVS